MKKRKISKFLLATSLSIGSFSSLPFTVPTVYAKEEDSGNKYPDGVFFVDFDSETEGMELPDEDDFWAIYDALAGQFPTGTVHVGDVFDGEVDLSHLDNPVPLPTPIRTTYVPKDGLGVWTFTGWDIDSLDPDDGSGGAVGFWAYRPYSEMQKVNVTYEFEAADGTSLPSEVLAYLPAAESHDVNTEVTATQPASVSVDVNEKKWVFKGYKEGNTQVAAQDIVFHGVWEQESTTYKASYRFESGTDSMELPEEVKALLPSDDNAYENEAKVTSKAPSQTSVEVQDGTWNFVSYDEAEKTVNRDNVEFVGTWTYTPKTYKASYRFESGTDSMELPEEVKALLPSDDNAYENEAKVTSKAPSQTSVEVQDGTWNFVSYDEAEKTVNRDNVEFVGTWTYTPKTYKASYRFESGTDSMELPEEVKALLPSDDNAYENEAKVTSKAPSQTSVEVQDGTWNFVSYDEAEKTVNRDNVEFVGTWTYTPKTYKASYRFESGTDSMELPEEVKALLPSDDNAYENEAKVTSKAPSQTSVEVQDGTWNFVSYDEAEKTVNRDNVEFVGTWTYTPKTYKASYRFESGTDSMELPEEVKALLPSDDNAYENEAKVTSKAPSQTSVEVQDGTWNFVSYDEAEKTVNRDNVEFVGTWTYTPKEYHVVYHFGSGSDDYDLPQEVMDLLPVDTQGYSNHEVVSTILPAQQKVTVENGEWVFKGYDADTKTVQNANVSFIGTWVFEANRYPVSYRFVSLTSGLDLPEEVNILLPFDEKDYEDQTTVHVKDLLQGQVKVANGTWLFEGFDAQEKVVNHAGVEFVGTWKFVAENEENPVYYHDHYQFVSTDSQYNLPDVILSMLPNDRSDYRDGETVHAILPMGQKVVLANGTWTFLGYDASEKVVHGQDVAFVGRWEYTPAPTEKTPSKEQGQPTNKTSASTKTKRVNTAVGSMMSLWTAFGSLSAMLAVLLKRKKK